MVFWLFYRASHKQVDWNQSNAKMCSLFLFAYLFFRKGLMDTKASLNSGCV